MQHWNKTMQLVYAFLGVHVLLAEVVAPYEKRWKSKKTCEEIKRVAFEDWPQTNVDFTTIDTNIFPDFWDVAGDAFPVDPRVATNGAEPPEQLVKVTDSRHKFPILATICSIGVLIAFITLLIMCTS